MPRLLACVFCAAAMYVTADAQTPGQNINMVSGTQWPRANPPLQRRNEAGAEGRTTERS